MKNRLLLIVTAITLLTFPKLNFGQAPDLGVASSFALFTAAGAFSNDGATVVTGDIGTNVGAFTGFPPGIVIGEIHVADPVSAQAATDVDEAYSYLAALTCGEVLSTTIGGGQILLPNIYCLGAASTINGDLILDGGGDPNSIFIFQIDGALSTTTLSNIILTNGASICNVFFQVNGAVELGVSSLFQGTIVANGAISLLDDATLNGRALTRAGAISLHNNTVNIAEQPIASTITASGPTTFCAGGSVTLSGNAGGTFNTGATTSDITVTTSGDFFITNTSNCGSINSDTITVTVNPLPTPSTITASGPTVFCPGGSVVLSGNNGGTFSNGATTPTITVTAAGDYFVTNTNSCGSVTSNHIVVKIKPLPVASTITASGPTTFCIGGSVVLSGNNGGTFSNGATTPTITVTTSGDYFVTNTNNCGSVTSNHIVVTVNECPPPSGCPAPVITLVDSLCGNVAIMCWTSVPGAVSYIIKWVTLPHTKWIYTTITAPDTCREFTNLFGFVTQLQVAAICANGDTSEYSPIVNFTNYLVCAAPSGLVSSKITATSAKLSWNANPDANNYQVQYTAGGNTTIITTKNTSLTLTGLPPSTTVKWMVKSRCKSCGINAWGTYSPLSSFTTASLKQLALDQQPASTLVVFPNPANVNFTVNFNIGYPSEQPYTIAILDLAGHVMMTEEGTLADGLLSQDVSLTRGISDGMYFVTITADGKQFRERLIVTK